MTPSVLSLTSWEGIPNAFGVQLKYDDLYLGDSDPTLMLVNKCTKESS